MKLSWILPLSLLVPALGLAALSGGGWDEGTSGDLSNDPAAPTAVAMRPGSNIVSGSMTNSGDTRDYLTFTLPAGHVLLQIRQLSYLDAGGFPGNTGFHSIIDGPTSLIPSMSTADDFLGGAHVDQLPAGTDMLPELATGNTAGSGFSLPLAPGTYTYQIQQTGPQLTEYELEFVVADQSGAVPAVPPAGAAALALLLVGAGAWAVRRRPAAA